MIVSFSSQLDSNTAVNLANYHLEFLGKDRRTKKVIHTTVAFRSATYNASHHEVTLTLSRRINLHQAYQLTVRGDGATHLVNALGQAFDRDQNGKPGGNFVVKLNSLKPARSGVFV